MFKNLAKILAVALIINLLAVAPAEAKARPKAFNGKTCTIVGTNRSETIKGTSKADVICGLGGNDKIDGKGGNDTIDSGAGNDTVVGGTGNDILDGGSGNDSLSGGTGDDILQGKLGADSYLGGVGTDTANFADKSAALVIDIDGVADDGTPGESDNVRTDIENITGGSGNDILTGSQASNFITGGDGADVIYGGEGNDTLYGTGGNDLLRGEVGNDFVDGGSGSDSLDGGSGTNKCTGGTNWWLELDQLDPTTCGDINAPHIKNLSFSSTSITTRDSSQSFEVMIGLQDDLVGIAGNGFATNRTNLKFEHPASGQWVLVSITPENNLLTGTSLDGTFKTTVTLPQGSAQGIWKLSGILTVDQVGNTRLFEASYLTNSGFPTSINQTGQGDSTAPTLTSLSFSSNAINTTNSSQSFDVTIGLHDDLVGIAGNGFATNRTNLKFEHPASGQWVLVSITPENNLLTGTSLDGTFKTTVTLPQGAAKGVWTLSAILTVDNIGNSKMYTRNMLNTLGFPSSFTNN